MRRVYFFDGKGGLNSRPQLGSHGNSKAKPPKAGIVLGDG